MAEFPEATSPKAARILAAAGELLLGRGARGFTVADVAQKAHVGKGTVYLYWASKEDLLLGLIVRDFLDLADGLVAALTADPGLARPSFLCPLLLRAAGEHRFVDALHSHDDVLGMLADDPRATLLLDTLGPSSVLRAMLPIWREHRLARTDWELDAQAYALHALVAGFVVVGREPGRHDATDAAATLAAAVAALVETEHPPVDEVQAATAGLVTLLGEAQRAVLAIIDRPVLSG